MAPAGLLGFVTLIDIRLHYVRNSHVTAQSNCRNVMENPSFKLNKSTASALLYSGDTLALVTLVEFGIAASKDRRELLERHVLA